MLQKRLVKSFAAEQQRLEAFASRTRGAATIRVDRVVGSVGRARELDSTFRYLSGEARTAQSARMRGIEHAMSRGVGLPPIIVYQILDEYYVVDGHHRVAAAKRLGQVFIDAEITEYLPDAADARNALFYEKREFRRATHLLDVQLSEPGMYPKLLNRIVDHQRDLAVRGHAVESKGAALDWFTTEYQPALETIKRNGLLKAFPGRTAGDIFVYIGDHRWMESKRLGRDIGLSAAIKSFRAWCDTARLGQRAKAARPERRWKINDQLARRILLLQTSRLSERLPALRVVAGLMAQPFAQAGARPNNVA